MYKKYLRKLLETLKPDGTPDIINLDSYVKKYSTTISKNEGFDERILEIVTISEFTQTNDVICFFKDLIFDAIKYMVPINNPNLFDSFINKTQMAFYVRHIIKICFNNEETTLSFTCSPFENYINLNDSQLEKFITFMHTYSSSRKGILFYLAKIGKTEYIKENLVPPFFVIDNVVLLFIKDCSILPELPLIHNITQTDIITIEYKADIINYNFDNDINIHNIILLFKDNFSCYNGVIRVWADLIKTLPI